MQELWAPIEGFNYSVSNLGNVMNDHTERILRPNSRPSVNLRKGGRYYCLYLPKLVADHWVHNLWRYPELFNTPMPMDGDKYNCRADNLDWRPRWFVPMYIRERRQPLYPTWKPKILCVERETVFRNPNEAGRAYGVLEEDIFNSIFHGRSVFPYRYHFEKYHTS